MGLFDNNGFGSNKQETITKPKIESISSDFDKTLVCDIKPLIKVKVIDDHYNLKELLEQADIHVNTTGNMYCPFHPDSITGKPSAKYHESTDRLYCFSENKMFSPYHALKFIYGYNINRVFMKIWSKLSKEERLAYLAENDPSAMETIQENNTLLEQLCTQVLGRFRQQQVNFKQYKHALLKVLVKVEEEEQ